MLNNQRQIFFPGHLLENQLNKQQTIFAFCEEKKNYALSGMGIRSSRQNNHDEQRN